MDVAWLPAINAALNATSAVLLAAGFLFIRGKRVPLHAGCMVAALAVSALFLASYLVYHARVGSVRFTGAGWIRPVYFAILVSHSILAVAVVPMALRTLWLASRNRMADHVALARRTLPIWLYVSVTGVVVYWMLYRSPWAA
jgi:putative membrane protein